MKNSILMILVILPAVFAGCRNRSLTPDEPGPDHLLQVSEFTVSSLGENVLLFDPSMDMKRIQAVIDSVHTWQTAAHSEFTNERFALLFKPGRYPLDIKIGYYTQVAGLGRSPGDVVIEGNIRSLTTRHGNVLTNFWRSVENLTVVPSPDTSVVWGVSQASPMRRVHIKGNLNLFDRGYASGGFLACSKVDGKIYSGPQQQWFTRNSETGGWEGGVWNMMFTGVKGAPASDFPDNPFTTIETTPMIREKPFIYLERNSFFITIPPVLNNSSGYDWASPGREVPLKKFHIAHAGKDNAGSINAALARGKHILLTPGRYLLDESLKVTAAGTIVMGMGLATLIPVSGNAAVEVSDADGIIICGITIDAGKTRSEVLLEMGPSGSGLSHSSDPSFLYDVFFRVGGPEEGSASACMVVNSSDVCIDHVWIWRADHGKGVGWDRNRCANGLIVNGDNVTIYGLFNEHFQEYQTLWKGNNGRVFFYQSEMPYDPPSVAAWSHDGINGYASYKVADNVTSHEAWGLGIYNVFYDAPVIVDNAIETPPLLEEKIHHKVIFWLNGNKESVVKSIINGKGGAVDVNNRKAAMK